MRRPWPDWPDWTSLEPELLARIYLCHLSGDFRLTCHCWRAAADANTEKLRFTFVPRNSFEGRGATAEDLDSLDGRFDIEQRHLSQLKVLEVECLGGSPYGDQLYAASRALDNNLQSLAALTALNITSTSAHSFTELHYKDSEDPALRVDNPRLLPVALKELGLTHWNQDDLTTLTALRDLTQLRIRTIGYEGDHQDPSDFLGLSLARLSTCTQLRAIALGLSLPPGPPQRLQSGLSQLTALHYLESLSLFEIWLEPAGIGQALSMLTGLTCLKLMLDCKNIGVEAAEASLGPLRSLGKLQQLAISAVSYYPPVLHDGGRRDVGFLTVLASLPGALQLCISCCVDSDDLDDLDEVFILEMGGLTRLTSLDLDLRDSEMSLNVRSLSHLRGLESLTWITWMDEEHIYDRDEGLVQLGQLPLTALHLEIGNSEYPMVIHQLGHFGANCVDRGRLMCLSIKQANVFSDIDLQTLGLLTSLTVLKLDHLPLPGSTSRDDPRSVEIVRQFRASADSAAIHHISSLTKLKRLHLEAFPSICNENVAVLQALRNLQYLRTTCQIDSANCE